MVTVVVMIPAAEIDALLCLPLTLLQLGQ